MPFTDYAFPQEPFSCFYGSSAAAIDAAAQEFHYKLVGSVSKLDLAYVPSDIWPWEALALERVTQHFRLHYPMPLAQADNLINYETWARGGTLCEAKTAAVKALLALANIKCRDDSGVPRKFDNQNPPGTVEGVPTSTRDPAY
jgi:hypothetical protein